MRASPIELCSLGMHDFYVNVQRRYWCWYHTSTVLSPRSVLPAPVGDSGILPIKETIALALSSNVLGGNGWCPG